MQRGWNIPDFEYLGNVLKRQREERLGLSLSAIGKRMGTSRVYAHLVEQNRKVPTREETIREVSDAYQLPYLVVRNTAFATRSHKALTEMGFVAAKDVLAQSLIRDAFDMTIEQLAEISLAFSIGLNTFALVPLGSQLKRRRRELGLSANETARRMGIQSGSAYIWLYEQGHRHPEGRTLERIARAYEMAVNELQALTTYSRLIRDVGTLGLDGVRRQVYALLYKNWQTMSDFEVAIILAVIDKACYKKQLPHSAYPRLDNATS